MDNKFIQMFTIFVMVIIILMFLQNQYGEVDYVKSHVDGRKYLVRKLPDAQEAADYIADINTDLVKLVRHMTAKYGTDEKQRDSVRMLSANYNPNKISEGSADTGYTSMTVNKGEKMILCIRQKDNTFVAKNVVMYVAIHELGHIMTYNETGHTPLFWENFRLLLKESIEIGIYVNTDYQSKPENYCGIKISSSVLHT